MKPRAVIYVRASLDMTGEERAVDRQEHACRLLAESRGWDVLAVASDNSVSAYGGKDRVGWRQVLGMAERGEVDYIVAWHLDRITRSMLDLEALIALIEKTTVGIATAVGDIDLSNDMGRMIARILAAVARAEVERKAARQRLGNQQLAATGEPWRGGQRPFGYEDDHVTIRPAEADAIRWAANAILDGTSMREVSRRWNEQGFRSARGAWSSNGVKKLIVHPRLVGIRTYLGEEVGPATWPAILDDDTHLALKAKFAASDPRFRHNLAGRTPSNLLSGIAVCDVCEAPLTGSKYRDTLIYSCRPRHVQPPREVLDAEVTAAVLGLLTTRGFLDSMTPADDERLLEARTELDALHRRMEVLSTSFAEGTLTESLFNSTARRVRDQIDALELTVAELGTGLVLGDLAVGTTKVVDQWPDLELARQRTIIETLLEVRVLRAARGTRWSAGDGLEIERRRRSLVDAL